MLGKVLTSSACATTHLACKTPSRERWGELCKPPLAKAGRSVQNDDPSRRTPWGGVIPGIQYESWVCSGSSTQNRGSCT